MAYQIRGTTRDGREDFETLYAVRNGAATIFRNKGPNESVPINQNTTTSEDYGKGINGFFNRRTGGPASITVSTYGQSVHFRNVVEVRRFLEEIEKERRRVMEQPRP